MQENKNAKDWVKLAQYPAQIERIEAFFRGHGYAPHRHDTYAIGCTLSGVQSFNYRSEKRHSLPGGMMVLHPDELHDGEAGTYDGFQYRMIYIKPSLIQNILGGQPLPFIPNGISSDFRLFTATQPLLIDMATPLETLEEEDALYDLVQTLAIIGGQHHKRKSFDYKAAELAREYIHSTFEQKITLDELSSISGRERWSLSRDFRALYGTSPYRYITMRRLEHFKSLILDNNSLANSALDAGFSDQSHMNRQFISHYGISPARWLKHIKGN